MLHWKQVMDNADETPINNDIKYGEIQPMDSIT